MALRVLVITLLCVLFNLVASNTLEPSQPEQIHIAFGSSVNDIVITWSTLTKSESIVQYGIGGFITSEQGNSSVFIDGGKKKREQYIHRVLLKDLLPNTRYEYRCGSFETGWSLPLYFQTVPDGWEWQPHLLIYGDMGTENAESLARLQTEAESGQYHAVLHVGDFAYDMATNNGEVGDTFMRQIEPIAAILPYMTCPGNHEEKYNFSHYRERFSMPGAPDSIMYSFNLGPMHIISISTEVYYFMNYGIKQLIFQYEWLVKDLMLANLNRAERPWILVMGHRPMYCSNANADDCTYHESMVRVGVPFLHWFRLEKLFYDYGVDLEIWAHEHSYERLWPIYDFQVYNGSFDQPYTNPGAPVHIVTGSAGCKEGREQFNVTRPDWSAFISSDYGYTRLKAFNRTHLYIEQISDDKAGETIDWFWIVKDRHGSYKHSQMDWMEIEKLRLDKFF